MARLRSSSAFSFAHDLLRQHSASELDDELADHRARIFTWAEHYQARSWPVDVTPLYLLDAYQTLLALEAADKLPTLLTDLAYLDTAIARVGVDRIASHVHITGAIKWGDAILAFGQVRRQSCHTPWPPP